MFPLFVLFSPFMCLNDFSKVYVADMSGHLLRKNCLFSSVNRMFFLYYVYLLLLLFPILVLMCGSGCIRS